MRIVQSWLHRYIEFDFPPVELAGRLTMLGLEVSHIDHCGEKFRGFVVGKVLECARHPNADRLTVCRVDVGAQVLQIVCGAPNVAPGQKVPVGTIGATVPRNQHDPSGAGFVLSQVSIRGVESFGMICSEMELDLGKDAAGIMVLKPGARVGQSLARYLGVADVVYDIEITPNRPDCLSHFGVAREIGALTGKLPVLPNVKLQESGELISRRLSVKVEDRQNCLRFAVRMLRGCRVAPSPLWLQRALEAAGLRPRNNIVDVTNFVMLECGQPLHAFDYHLLRGEQIVVRQAAAGTLFRTLDGQEHELPGGTVMVCDGEREVSIAGVMGGANSEIGEETRDVVVESAYWNPSSIRRTSKALGISTDASQRFERGADPNGVSYALNRATQLIAELTGGTVLKGTIDIYPKKVRERKIRLRSDRVNKVLGTTLRSNEIAELLRRLRLKAKRGKSGVVTLSIPTYRVDLEREIDLIEEVARVHGYNKIPDKTRASVDLTHHFPMSTLADRVRGHLIGLGFHEAVSNSMLETGKAAMGGGAPVMILNPQNKEMASLRTTLVTGLLEAVARNQSFGSTDLRLFEIGRVFCVDDTKRGKLVENFLEEERVCFLLTGLREPRHWSSPSRNVDIFDAKGEVLNLLKKFALDKTELISYPTSVGLADQSLHIEINGSYAGYLGSVRSDLLKVFGVEGEIYVAEIILASLAEGRTKRYVALPRFPRVKRDLAFIVGVSTAEATVEEVIRKSSSNLLQHLELFDVYQGDKLPEGKKSLAFSLELMSIERTLTEEEIESEVRNIVRCVEQQCGATWRTL